MKATTLLERQHRSLRELCDTIEHGSVNVRLLLVAQLAGDLWAHLTIEKTLFYPKLDLAKALQYPPLRDARADGPTRLACPPLNRVLETPAADVAFEHRVMELRTWLETHIAREETSVFPHAERALTADELRALGTRMITLYAASNPYLFESFEIANPRTVRPL